MTATVLISVTIIVLVGAGSEALPTATSNQKQSLISILLQAPPVAEAACFVRDVNSAEVIVNKVCDCDGSTVACDVGPMKLGDIEVTFCNKKPNQPMKDLLVMKFACDISDSTCGEDTVCDIGPIEYGNKKYYLCTYQTGMLSSSSGFGVCRPAMNRTDSAVEDEPETPVTKADDKPDSAPIQTELKPPLPAWNPPIWEPKPKTKFVNPNPPAHDSWSAMMVDQGPWWNMGPTFDDQQPVVNSGGPGVHVYERRRWRIGNKGGEIIKGKKRPHWNHDSESSVSSSEEK